MSINNVHLATTIDTHTELHLVRPDPGLTHTYSNSTAHNIPEIAVSPSQGKFLSLLTTISSARNVLEIGTLGGYSSICFARALKAAAHNHNHDNGTNDQENEHKNTNGRSPRPKGKVTSIEIDPARRELSIQNLTHANVKVPEEAEVLLGAALDVLPRLGTEIEAGTRERFDFVFVDADWERQWEYFDWGVKLCKGRGSVVYVDNVVRALIEGGFVEGEGRGVGFREDREKEGERGEGLVEKVGRDGRVEAVVMQTVGAKDYDGFLMAVVK